MDEPARADGADRGTRATDAPAHAPGGFRVAGGGARAAGGGARAVGEGDGRPSAARGVGRRAVAASAVWGAALVLGGGGVARATAVSGPRGAAVPGARDAALPGPSGAVLRLPAPTGPYPIGATTLYLRDPERADPWLGPASRRAVMATVWYPARGVSGRPPTPQVPLMRQMTPRAAGSFAVWAPRLHPGLPTAGVDWAATTTHAHPDAPVRPGRRPVLLYTPGGGDPRTLGTHLAEELASHGAVVVTVDHPGDASEVEFPDGTLRETVFRGDPRADPELFRTVIATRVADVRFVLDRLVALAAGWDPGIRHPLPPGLPRVLDLGRVGVYGHSAGGTTAAQVLYEDRRIAAAMNMEGYLSHPPAGPGQPGSLFPVARDGVDRPLLLLGTDGFRNPELERSWSAMLDHSGGRATWHQLADAAHGTLTDYAALVPQLQRAALLTAEQRAALVGTVAPTRSVPLVRRLVRAFFARSLGAGPGGRPLGAG